MVGTKAPSVNDDAAVMASSLITGSPKSNSGSSNSTKHPSMAGLASRVVALIW